MKSVETFTDAIMVCAFDVLNEPGTPITGLPVREILFRIDEYSDFLRRSITCICSGNPKGKAH